MVGRRFVLVLLIVSLGAAAWPLLAQSSDTPAMNFWMNVGRFRVGAAPAPADLSGDYKVNGTGDGGKPYSTTLDMKKSKTVTTPQGAKVNIYQLTWNWNDGKVKGVGLMLGSRLYVAYGSENLSLSVIAPFTLTDNERPAYESYYAALKAISGKQDKLYVKNPPWFADYVSYIPGFNSAPYPAYYMLWVNPRGGYGHKFASKRNSTGPLTWTAGVYGVGGHGLKDNGEAEPLVYSSLLYWHVTKIGDNYRIAGRDTDVLRRNAKPSDDDIDGTAMTLDDGTVVALMGGNDSCGFGYYDVKDKALTGPYAVQFTNGRASETLTPSAAVLAKNARLFGQ